MAIAAVSLAAALAACGDDDEGPSKSEYIEKADAVCAKADVTLDEIYRTIGENPTPQKAQEALAAMLPEERGLLAELTALEKPADDQDEIDGIYAARDSAVDEMAAAARSPASALAYVESKVNSEGAGGFEEASRRAAEYGMVDCESTHPGSVASG